MALKIESEETAKLAAEIARLTGESDEQAVDRALRETRARLGHREPRGSKPRNAEEFRRFMEREIWPLIPERERGGPPIAKAQRAELLGYGPGRD